LSILVKFNEQYFLSSLEIPVGKQYNRDCTAEIAQPLCLNCNRESIHRDHYVACLDYGVGFLSYC
jgi:hypothetical protein